MMTNMELRNILNCAVIIITLVQTEVLGLPIPRDMFSKKLLDHNNGVDEHMISAYGFSVIKNTSFPCQIKEQMRFQHHTLSDDDKRSIFLMSGGSFYKEYMAVDLKEAEENFINLLGTYYEDKKPGHKHNIQSGVWKEPRLKRDLMNMLKSTYAKRQIPIPEIQKSRIKSKIKALKEPDKKSEELQLGENIPYSVLPDHERDSWTKDNETGAHIRYEYCRNRGQKTRNGSHLYMCTTCATTTNLEEASWPRIVNEARRLEEDKRCFIADGVFQGVCKQQVMPMLILKKRDGYCSLAIKDGNIVIVEKWVTSTFPLNIGCECVISSISNFAVYVGKYVNKVPYSSLDVD